MTSKKENPMPDETTESRLRELEELSWQLLAADVRIKGLNWGPAASDLFAWFVANESLPWLEAGCPEPRNLPPAREMSPAALRQRKSRARKDFQAACRRIGLVPTSVLVHKHILNILKERGDLPKSPTESQIAVSVSRLLEDVSDMLADGLME